MATTQKSGTSSEAVALMIVRVTAGAYLLFIGIHKLPWLFDSTPMANQLAGWLEHAPAISRWYLDRIIPGTPVIARLVPLAEIIGGFALAVGFWTRLTAGFAFLMVLNVQIAAGAIFNYAYLTDATGLPMLGTLLGLAIGGGRLPFSLRR